MALAGAAALARRARKRARAVGRSVPSSAAAQGAARQSGACSPCPCLCRALAPVQSAVDVGPCVLAVCRARQRAEERARMPSVPACSQPVCNANERASCML